MLHSPLVIIIAQASRLPEFPLIKGRHPAEIGLVDAKLELESLDIFPITFKTRIFPFKFLKFSFFPIQSFLEI